MLTRIGLICVAVFLVAQTPVHAYTDPGSGTLILQMLIAASFGVMFYLRRIFGWFRRLKTGKEKSKEGAEYSSASEESKSVNG